MRNFSSSINYLAEMQAPTIIPLNYWIPVRVLMQQKLCQFYSATQISMGYEQQSGYSVHWFGWKKVSHLIKGHVDTLSGSDTDWKPGRYYFTRHPNFEGGGSHPRWRYTHKWFLLKHLGIEKRMQSYHAHNEHKVVKILLQEFPPEKNSTHHRCRNTGNFRSRF